MAMLNNQRVQHFSRYFQGIWRVYRLGWWLRQRRLWLPAMTAVLIASQVGHDKSWEGPQPWEKTQHEHRITPKTTDIFWRPHQVLFFWNDDHTVDSVDRKWLCPFLRKRNVGGRMKIGKNDLNDHIHQVFEMCSHLLSYITQASAEIPHTSGMQAYTLQTIKHFFLSAGNTRDSFAGGI